MKKTVMVLLAAVMVLAFSFAAFAGTWEQNGSTWKYKNDDGSYVKSAWQWVDGKCYCFDENGVMYASVKTPDGYDVNADGAWVVGGVVQTQGQGTAATTDSGSHPSGQQIVDYLNQFRSSTTAYLNGYRAGDYFLVDSSRPAWNNGVTNVKWIGHVQPVSNLPNYSIDGYGGWIWWEYNNGDYCPIAINEEHYIIADTVAPDGLYVNKYGICSVGGRPVSHCSGCFLVAQTARIRAAYPGPDYSKVNTYADGGFSEIDKAFVNCGVDYKGMFIDYGTLSVNHWTGFINNERVHGGFYDCCYVKLP